MAIRRRRLLRVIAAAGIISRHHLRRRHRIVRVLDRALHRHPLRVVLDPIRHLLRPMDRDRILPRHHLLLVGLGLIRHPHHQTVPDHILPPLRRRLMDPVAHHPVPRPLLALHRRALHHLTHSGPRPLAQQPAGVSYGHAVRIAVPMASTTAP